MSVRIHRYPAWRTIVAYAMACAAYSQSPLGWSAEPAALPRIDPRDVPGTVMVIASPSFDAQLAECFLDHIHENGSVAVVTLSSSDNVSESAWDQVWPASRVGRISFLTPDSLTSGPEAERWDLTSYDGVWISAPEQPSFSLTHLGHQCRGILARNGTVAVAGPISRLVFSHGTTGETAQSEAGWDLIPDSQWHPGAKGASDEQLPSAKLACPHSILFTMDCQSGLILSGRRIWSVTRSPVRLVLPESRVWPERIVRLSAEPLDFTAIRRAARARIRETLPSKTPADEMPQAEVAQGTLMLVGGGELPDGLIERFVHLAGGNAAQIVILPTALPDPIPCDNPMSRRFAKAGARTVTVLPQRELAEIASDEFLNPLRSATGVWLDGGRQWRYVDALEDTLALEAVFELLRRGGIVGGSSAGASIQAEYLVRGNPLGNEQIMAEGYERGFGLLRGTAVDQHFTQRGRRPELERFVQRYPNFLGIGLDESTAIVVRESTAEVSGIGSVFFIVANDAAHDQPIVHQLRHGERYNLMTRRKIVGDSTQP